MSAALRSSLEDLRAGRQTIDDFLMLWRREAPAYCAPLSTPLSTRFAEVLEDLLTRLESSRLFDADSCSFSRSDLLAHLEVWLDKADARRAAL
ncbi:hypothetical protein [Niveibacterium sp. SC-1]|uniref:hypothetical protein n=1 Tax=Niveibacterium sp. SC-1 TaxID=3135646 RepID=UPI00311E26BC